MLLYNILQYIIYIVSVFFIFIIFYAMAMGLLNDICGCANDYALTNLWN